MKRWPLIPTIFVAGAMLVMIGLGIWQLRRMDEKNALLAEYAAAATKPPIAWPAVPVKHDAPLFRRATGFCTEVTGWSASAGRNAKGEAGWAHIAACRTGGAEGPGMQVDMGWSRDAANPAWTGGEVTGIVAPDTRHIIRLISQTPAPGLEPSQPPAMDDIPNNHLAYAVQWFFFAAVAGVIYALALRRRKQAPGADAQR
ncbi:SURF1 family protein [Sphingomonas sp. LaA6.9]|uniref:SURF1 family protein n=1 Tax=Sphingomonas sp. LaA6.9 TaxID=2919914 RepID=UPI001F4F2F08|nr:SURF1 family protein [Sphingomonas sp. LaA6.9]MCJ8159050.1 SURF1 family protein [Sphingomonas sp. LaA6.9]